MSDVVTPPEEEEVCAGCGLERGMWMSPTVRDGEAYCCERCAAGGPCDCAGAITD